MIRHNVMFQGSVFSYLTGGTGDQILLCLHGFGEDADTFSFLEMYLPKEFTMYAIDLPWHGQTKWNHQHSFTAKELTALLQEIIPGFTQKKMILLGYSMGGRIALSLIEKLPEQIKSVVLLAPDGLRVNPWYWLATQTGMGNRLFRYTMYHPGWFKWMIDVLRRLRLANTSIAKFVHAYIDDPQIRQSLYRIWTTMRTFRPNLTAVKQQLILHKINLSLVFGKHDRIILSKNGYSLQKGCSELIHVLELNSGHLLLKEKHAATIISLLRQD